MGSVVITEFDSISGFCIEFAIFSYIRIVFQVS